MSGICPYPGLRPFTEEESIFFKGRDLHIRQIVKLLEENKMAFITGASGDGKSSMVYAGVIPYIRAGFFKAQFNGWLICDFKPQRNPLASMAESISNEMDLDYEHTLAELSQGFSSLVDIYLNSEFYAQAANSGKNLLIIADQFEEVFTMSENFTDGTPSNECYTAINLLLETVRISISKKLPVYVVFTMRSDYISQCTVFKSLPEFIAYSQFFVPQLKRTEIRQVIEEPALLAGGSVSSRLTEVLINNLNSGFDQLPVLQHALSLLWKTADNGTKQLDLIHLAKIAGISKDVLSDNEKAIFDNWFESLPKYQHKYYEHPDLNNVLNAHAGILYESAYDYFMQNANWAEKSITAQESKQIIEVAFKCLTKIDNNRQVRNRCTLSEITGVINKDNVTNATVCGVLNIFRSQGNTLLRPFTEEGKLETQYLSGDTVLDVTHEALIRNWKTLALWDAEEAANLKDYNDFSTQMQRWLTSGRANEFLLDAGTFNYFNEWYNKCQPNKFWLSKHDNSKLTPTQKERAAELVVENCEDFIEISSVTIKNKEKKRRRRIMVTIVSLIGVAIAPTMFSIRANQERQIADKQRMLADSQSKLAYERQQYAEQQTHLAELAEKIAKEQRDTAQMMARRALLAVEESDRARKRAIYMSRTADTMRRKAEENYALAEQRRQEAFNQSQEVLKQMRLTAEANDSASRLYNIAVSNTLAMKAKNQYEDKSLNLRLAKTAYDLSRKNGVKQNDAELYDAMLFALEENGLLKPLSLTTENIRSFTIDEANKIVVITAFGVISEYKFLSNGKTREVTRIEKYGTKVPIEKAIFISPKVVVYSTKDKNTYLVDIKKEQRIKLSGQNDYIKSAIIVPDNHFFITAYSNGKINVLSLDDLTNDKPIASVNMKARITDIYCDPSNNVYVLMHDGSLCKWNFNTNKIKEVIPKPETNINAFAMAAIVDKKLLALCYSDGNMQFVDTRTDTKEQDRLRGHSKLENLVYNTETGVLALSSADKRISLIDTKKLNAKTLSIEEHSLNGSKVKCMCFNGKGVLYALTDDNMLRFWDTNIHTYANQLSTMGLTPLTEGEWALIMGEEFTKKEGNKQNLQK